MARSTYVYLVYDNNERLGAFTVKREADEFIERMENRNYQGRPVLELFRLRDGCGDSGVKLSRIEGQ